MPIAYSALPKGTPVLSTSGTQFGVVEHVLEIPAEDLFDGIVVSAEEGLRFVDRDQIDNIATAQVRCVLTDEQAQTPSPPDDARVYQANALQDSGSSLHDRFGRTFRRAHWYRED